MTVTVASFRAAFPAFTDTTLYPDPQVQLYLDLSVNLMDQIRWGNLLDYGTQLFVAHNLALEAPSTADAAAGGLPGQIKGSVTSGSVDKVSYSRDVSSAMLPNAGHWNLTSYGLRFKQLINMIGAGPIQVGGLDPMVNVSAWQGPTYFR